MTTHRVGDLRRVVRKLDELDRRRAMLLDERDALLVELLQDPDAPGATTLARVVALTTTAVYKIVRRDGNRAVTLSQGGTAHEHSRRARSSTKASTSTSTTSG